MGLQLEESDNLTYIRYTCCTVTIQRIGYEMKQINIPEFFNPWCLSAVALFAVNNIFWKYHYPGWFTGKLSDFAACYFLPLFISALLSLLVNWTVKQRLLIGVTLTSLIFTLVKTSVLISEYMNMLLSKLTSAFGLGPSINLVDPTDLIALPLIGITYLYTLKRMEILHETTLAE